jgi:hypothetical protein
MRTLWHFFRVFNSVFLGFQTLKERSSTFFFFSKRRALLREREIHAFAFSISFLLVANPRRIETQHRLTDVTRDCASRFSFFLFLLIEHRREEAKRARAFD